MTTTLQNIIAAQDAVQAEGGSREDWKRVAIRLAGALVLAEHSMSKGHLRFNLLAGIKADIKPDDAPPLDVTEPVSVQPETSR